MYDIEDIALEWKEYLKKLYESSNETADVLESSEEMADDIEGSILREEFELAMIKLIYQNVSGTEEMPAKRIKAAIGYISNARY